MKHVKFIKDHPSGNFFQGDVVAVSDQGHEAWTGSDYCENATEKEFEAYKKAKADAIKKEKEKQLKAKQKKDEKIASKNPQGAKVQTLHPSGNSDDDNDGEDSGNEDGTGSDGGSDGSNDGADNGESKFVALTEKDLTDHPEASEGLEAGMEVEVNDKDEFLLDENDKFIVKPTE